MTRSHETRHTLLLRACNQQDERAWQEIHENYRRFIRYILGEIGIDPDEAEDVSQEVLVTLTSSLPRYDRTRAKFRTWLSALIRNVALAHLRAARTRRRYTERYQVDQQAILIESASELDSLIESEWETYVATIAMERVRKVFKGQAIEVFELGLNGCPAADVAEQTGMAIASVYTMRKRVKKRLYQEIRIITAELES